MKTKTWLDLDGNFVIGDGGATLMLAILEHGSLLRRPVALREQVLKENPVPSPFVG